MTTFIIIADEIGYRSAQFLNFGDCRDFIENSKVLDKVNSFKVIEQRPGYIMEREYSRIIIK